MRFFQNSTDNVSLKDRQMSEMRANLDSLNAQFSSFQATAATPQNSTTHNPHNQQFGYINCNFRVNALDVPVKPRSMRDLSPTGLSTNHAKELLNTLGEFVKISPNLDEGVKGCPPIISNLSLISLDKLK